MSYTAKQIQEFADAMWQLLDDMGRESQSVCLGAKLAARVAFEPFRDKAEENYADWLTAEEAQAEINKYEAMR